MGRGADFFDVEGFGAEAAYTVDGGALGELEYENFNAASGHVTIQGKVIHPGSAKGKMKNALLIAMEFQALLSGFVKCFLIYDHKKTSVLQAGEFLCTDVFYGNHFCFLSLFVT